MEAIAVSDLNRALAALRGKQRERRAVMEAIVVEDVEAAFKVLQAADISFYMPYGLLARAMFEGKTLEDVECWWEDKWL
jgi:hypothetical protein